MPLGHILSSGGTISHSAIPGYSYREEFPLNKADLHRRISKAIASAVGNYLLEDSFKAELPTLPFARQHPSFHRPPTLESLVALRQPLENLAIKIPRVGGSISVLVCTPRAT